VRLRCVLSVALAGGCLAAAAAAATPLRAPVVHERFTLLPCPASAALRDSTIGIEGCQEQTIIRADRQIDSLALAIFSGLGAPAAKRRFVTAEAAWLAYRQAFCASESDLFVGGSEAPVEFGACAVSLDEQHVKDLTGFASALRRR
jgi:uncharacterized protein YecT (DUF1311 family)